TLQFASLLTFYAWMAGYVSTWFVLRRQNVWVAIMLGAITIVVNLSKLTSEYSPFLFWFLLAALVLLAQTRLNREHQNFKTHQSHLSPRSIVYSVSVSVCLALLVVSLAWFTPAVKVQRLEQATSNIPWRKNIETYLEKLLSTVPAKYMPSEAEAAATSTVPKRTTLLTSEQQNLALGDSWDGSEDVHFVVTSRQPSYWRTRSYDVYSPTGGWTSSPGSAGSVTPPSLQNETELSGRDTLAYSVRTSLQTDTFLSAGEPFASDTPVITETLTPKDFVINLTDNSGDKSLPSDLAVLARSLREAQKTTRPFGNKEVSQLLPQDLTLKTTRERPPAQGARATQAGQLTQIVLTRKTPVAGNSVVISLPSPLNVGQRYAAVSRIIPATPEELSQAGEDYPNWVTDYYLQLPSSFSERVRRLAESITQDAETPYDKAAAIRSYLAQFAYTLYVPARPQGVDGVEYFLFNQKSGFCTYFASAMTTMLRSVNVPARLAVGYNPGERDVAEGTFILRGKNSHAWPEVYFPGYGWVGFEASPPARISGGFIEEEELFPEPVFGEEGNPVATTTSVSGWKTLGFLLVIPGILLMTNIARKTYRRRLRFPGRDYSFEVYARLCLWASLAGLGPRPQQTPVEFGTSLSMMIPQQAGAIQSIVHTYLESRYSPRRYSGVQKRRELEQSWKSLYRALLKRSLRLNGKRPRTFPAITN
ncbi:MAG: transglutaminase domain-containing protein, partial [Chloroflexi bacterium]|nr:transglutaminase domain-containing protein [Chloroflexota bacterium]